MAETKPIISIFFRIILNIFCTQGGRVMNFEKILSNIVSPLFVFMFTWIALFAWNTQSEVLEIKLKVNFQEEMLMEQKSLILDLESQIADQSSKIVSQESKINLYTGIYNQEIYQLIESINKSYLENTK